MILFPKDGGRKFELSNFVNEKYLEFSYFWTNLELYRNFPWSGNELNLQFLGSNRYSEYRFSNYSVYPCNKNYFISDFLKAAKILQDDADYAAGD